MKDSTVRINDVLTTINNSGNLLTQAESQLAYTLANNFITARFPATAAGTQPYEAFSKGMSLGFHLGRDTDGLRNMKRACYLLDAAMRDKNGLYMPPPFQIGQIGDPRTAFRDYLRKAANLQATGSAAAQAALNSLTAQPDAFLRTNKLMVMGSTQRGQGDANVLTFQFGYKAEKDNYVFDQIPFANYLPVQVDSVTAQHYAQVPGGLGANNSVGNFSQIRAVKLTSAVMVTTQFTGCTFCFKETGGDMFCAHISPHVLGQPHPTTGPILAQSIANTGNFSNAGGAGEFRTFGSSFSHNLAQNAGAGGYIVNGGLGSQNWMTIIGIRGANNSYEFWSQSIASNKVLSSKRIH